MIAILFFLIIAKTVGETEVYLNDESELVKVTPDRLNPSDGIEKRTITFKKVIVQKEIEIIALRVEHKITYCPASANFMSSEKCLEESTFLRFSEDKRKDILDARSCPASRKCSESECDGISLSECQEQTLRGGYSLFMMMNQL